MRLNERAGEKGLPDIATPRRQAAEVRRIASLPQEAVLRRCDGTLADLDVYRQGLDEPGWAVFGRPLVGELLLSTVGFGASRRIVSLCRIEGVSKDGSAIWDDATDVSLRPALPWRAVCHRAKQPAGNIWGTLDGTSAQNFLVALATEVEESSDVSASEGERRDKHCRQRSTSNRIYAIERSLGQCQGCGLNLTRLFGSRGEQGLEVHHNIPMQGAPQAKRVTSLTELTVLCATCHRLLHADPDMSLDSLRVGWSIGKG